MNVCMTGFTDSWQSYKGACYMQCYEQEKLNNKWKLALAALIINFAITIGIVIYLVAFTGQSSDSDGKLSFDNIEHGQYVMYIGTNDKDTYEQLIPNDEAREIVNSICKKHVEGWTSSDSKGGWVDEKDMLTQEATLVYTFIYVEESQVIAIMDEVMEALNQNSILLERRDVSSVFYNGSN